MRCQSAFGGAETLDGLPATYRSNGCFYCRQCTPKREATTRHRAAVAHSHCGTFPILKLLFCSPPEPNDVRHDTSQAYHLCNFQLLQVAPTIAVLMLPSPHSGKVPPSQHAQNRPVPGVPIPPPQATQNRPRIPDLLPQVAQNRSRRGVRIPGATNAKATANPRRLPTLPFIPTRPAEKVSPSAGRSRSAA